MEEQWKVLLYKTPQGETPVNEFILNLELTPFAVSNLTVNLGSYSFAICQFISCEGSNAQSKVYNALELLKTFGTFIGSPHIKKLTGTKLWELRILGSDSLRILYITITGKTFLLLHSFKKKKAKTPPKEIRIAEGRLAEFRSRR